MGKRVVMETNNWAPKNEMQKYKVTPTETEGEPLATDKLLVEEEESDHFEEKKRPWIIDFICSIRLAIITLVLSLCVCIAVLSVIWGVVSGGMVNDVTDVMRSQIMMTIQNKISDKLTPIKLASASVMAIKATNWNDSDPQTFIKGMGNQLIIGSKTTPGQTVYLLISDVRNDSFISYMSFTGSNASTAPILGLCWKGVTPQNESWYYSVPLAKIGTNINFATKLGKVNSYNSAKAYRDGKYLTQNGWTPAHSNPNYCTRNTTTGVLIDCTIWLNYYTQWKLNASQPYADWISQTSFVAKGLSSDIKTFTDTIPGSVIILIERATGAIASSSDTSNILVYDDPPIYTMIPAVLYNNTLAAAAATYLVENIGYANIGDGANQTKKGAFTFNFNNGRVLGNYGFVTDGPESGLDWIILMAIPENSFIGKYITTFAILAAVSFAVMLAGILMGLIATFIVVKPLYTLVNRMGLVQTMDFEALGDYGKHLSIFGEIRAIQTAFLLMVEKLKEYKAFLPSSVRFRYTVLTFQILQRDFGEEEEENDQEKDDFSRGASFTQSRRPSSKPASYQASYAGTHKGKLKAFALGLEAKEISVLYIDIYNLDELLLTYSPNDVVNQHGRLLTEIFKIAARSKGDISFFNQKKFVVTWNASTRSRHHALEACSTAVQVREVVQKLTQQLQQLHQFSKPMHVVIGVATGLSYAGNIGTQSKRQFATFGTTQNLVEHITSLSTEWNNAILIPSATAEYVKKKFNVRPLDYVRIKDSPKVIEDRIYELYDRKAEHADDEWMYSMEKEKQESKFAKVAEGFEARLHSEYDKAISLLDEFLEKNPNDRNVEKLKELCEKWKSEGNEGLVVHTKQENAWEYNYDN